MRRRLGIIVLAVGALLAVATTAAVAAPVDQANGSGQSPLSAAFGFTVDGALGGQFTYTSDPQGATPEFWAQCDDFTSVTFVQVERRQTAKVTATCTDKDGNTVYLKAALHDRGEPGTRDGVCILWSYDPNPTESNSYIHDMGRISNGNIQIHMH
jgi:hypothetical protein